MRNAYLPDEVLRGNQLELQPLEPRHAVVLFDGLQDQRLYDFIADQPPVSVEALRARYMRLAGRRSPDDSQIWLNWAVWSDDEARFIGYVQATILPDTRAVVAYVLFPDAWGKGYAFEAVGLMIAYLRTAQPDLEIGAYVDVRNGRSIALLGRLGFTCIAVKKDAELVGEISTDEAEFRLGR